MTALCNTMGNSTYKRHKWAACSTTRTLSQHKQWKTSHRQAHGQSLVNEWKERGKFQGNTKQIGGGGISILMGKRVFWLYPSIPKKIVLPNGLKVMFRNTDISTCMHTSKIQFLIYIMQFFGTLRDLAVVALLIGVGFEMGMTCTTYTECIWSSLNILTLEH